jgi:gliding-associated putative ABC transporter substrate-binding component GldG
MSLRGNIKKDLIQYLALLFLLVVLAWVSSRWFFRVDLTSEKRYTLSQSTRTILREMDGVVYFRIYLDGDLPQDFVRFRTAIEEILDEFRAYAGDQIQYAFVNLYDEPDEEARNRMIAEVYNKGLMVTSIQMKDAEGGRSEKIIFPGAIASYRGFEFPVNLLKNNPALPHQTNLANSIQSLEYELARAVQSLTLEEVPKIAFIEGHGELDSLRTFSLMDELKNFFQVDRGFINGNAEALRAYEAIIIAQPVFEFSEADKYAIDQYIMYGGKVLWFIDPVRSRPDSLASGMTIALANPLNVEDLLFKYGVRIDYNLVADMQCSFVPVNTAPEGQESNFVMKPWIYFPLFTAYPDHPITRGLNYIKGQFASAMDTLDRPDDGVKATVLLSTSNASKVNRVPMRIAVDEVTREPDPRAFTDMHRPVAVMLEGEFESFYANYPAPSGVYPPGLVTRKVSAPTSMLVVTDGDILRNEVSISSGTVVPEKLGYDKYTRQTFGNLEFIMNAINYMTDQTGLMELRSREFKLRLLNNAILNDKGAIMRWKVVNTLLPVVLVILFGIGFQISRRKKYAA